MSTVLEDEYVAPTEEDGREDVEEHLTPEEDDRIDKAAERVRLTYKGCRVKVRGIPSRRSVNDTQKAQAADLFGADESSVSMSTLLWNSEEKAVKDLRKVIAAITRTFHDKALTLPTKTDGLRMIKRDCVTTMHGRLKGYKTQLATEARQLSAELPAIIEREESRRGTLFNREDYSFDPVALVSMTWSFPAVVEDNELAELDDEVYQSEIARVRGEFRQVVQLKEAQMAEELTDMLDAVVERLGGVNETGKRKGKQKTFKDESVNKLFDEIQHMADQLKDNSIGGADLVKAAKRIGTVLKGQSADTLPDALRGNQSYRDHVRTKFGAIAEQLLETAVPVQRRKILRKKATDRRKPRGKAA